MLDLKGILSVDQSPRFYEPRERCTFKDIRSILIADENSDVLDQLSQSFSICAKQYIVFTAQNGRDALEVLKTSRVNILLTALHMPLTNGFELADYAKYYCPDTRIFIMSEEDPAVIKNRLDDLRICGYVRKPFPIEMVYSTLRV